jgi:hypothetical protein
MSKLFQWLYLSLACLISFSFNTEQPPEGIQFTFKNRQIFLTSIMKVGNTAYFPRSRADDATLDTLSNWHSSSGKYVEIIRQDKAQQPAYGLAMGFEFDEDNGEYPYTPAHAVMQLKDFGWGGMEFSLLDTMNYTGVSNAVSDDIQIEIEGFEKDTIWGRFSGVLVSGSGKMASIEDGKFKARVYRTP